MKPHVRIAACLIAAAGFNCSVASADPVIDWNQAALEAIRVNRTTPPEAARALAILHIAVFDAVNGMERSYESFLVPSRVAASASADAAASAAARLTLTELFPSNAVQFGALYDQLMRGIATGPQRQAGINWGESVGTFILAVRANDNSTAVVTPPSSTRLDAWQPTPPTFSPYLLPQWGGVSPFVIPNGSFVRPDGPPSLDTAQWAAEYNEVKVMGAAAGSSRTAEQDLIARFWADGAGTATPPGHWNRVAQAVVANRGGTLIEQARLFALLNVAMADAAISVWDAKYTYNFWRPVTAIRNGDADGNGATVADDAWSPFITTPPFPEYVSGHSAFSAAAATVLTTFYGTDLVNFYIGSDAITGVERHFASFTAAALEAAMSRIYGGIHFRSAVEDGLTIGIEVGMWTSANSMQPARNRLRR